MRRLSYQRSETTETTCRAGHPNRIKLFSREEMSMMRITRQNGINNRRKFPRFKVKGNLFVLHRDMGQVHQIGIGGILFTYVEKLRLQGNYPEKGILFTETDFLVEIPFKTISDTYLGHFPSSQLVTRQRIVIFNNLAADHLDLLEKMILANVNIPATEDYMPMKESAYCT
jgi:hypothetical protein